MNDTPRLLRVGSSTLIIGVLVIMVLPLLWITTSSLKSTEELISNPFGLPASWWPQNIIDLWVGGAFPRYFVNSLFITLVAVGGIVVFSTMAGYALARSRLHVVTALAGVFILGMYIPQEALLIPVFRIVDVLGVRNTPWAVILVQLSWTPVAIFLMRSHFLAVPEELVNAARVDGCSEFQLFTRIFLPLAKPAIITIAVIYTLWSWNDFIWPLILLQDPEQYTVQLGVLRFKQEYTTNYGLQLAGLVAAVWPPLVAYLLFRGVVQQNLMSGAVKE